MKSTGWWCEIRVMHSTGVLCIALSAPNCYTHFSALVAATAPVMAVVIGRYIDRTK